MGSVTAIISGLVGGAAALALGTVWRRIQKPPAQDGLGWKRLRPGWYIHFILFTHAALVAFLAFFFAIGGSAGTDADAQNFMALALLASFAGAGIWIFRSAYLRKIEWRGDEIRLRRAGQPDALYSFSDVVDVTENLDGFQCKLHFFDGRKLNVCIYSHGSSAFMERLSVHLPEQS